MEDFYTGNRTVLIVGAGVIGLSWAHLFRSAGWTVRVNDPRDDLPDLLEREFGSDSGVVAVGDLQEAASDVNFVQEAGPERISIKQEIFRTLAEATTETTVLASSTSSLLPSTIAEGNPSPDRVLVGHPFNPPQLMPLVEVVPSPRTSQTSIDRALNVYRELGQNPVALQKEIRGFVGNRLQRVIGQEATFLVQEGIVTPAQLDEVVVNSIGLRWVTVGPFEGQRLGGGPSGARHILEHVGAAMDFENGTPDPVRIDEVIEAIDADFGNDQASYNKRVADRDRRTKSVLDALQSTERPQEIKKNS